MANKCCDNQFDVRSIVVGALGFAAAIIIDQIVDRDGSGTRLTKSADASVAFLVGVDRPGLQVFRSPRGQLGLR